MLCLSLKTGKVKWKQTAFEGKPAIPKHRGNSYASETPVTDGERVIAHFGVKGIAHGPKFELIATNRLDDGIFWSSAAISGNQVLLRRQHHIYCIRK